MGGTANPVRRPCAAREILELILHSKGIWEEMIDKARLSLAKMLSVANAFEISDFQEDGIEVTRTRRLECNNVTCLLSPGCAGDGQVGREFGKAWPELLHDAADSGLTSPMATFSAHTASPPPPRRTPSGSRASSRHGSIVPRTTSARGRWPGLHHELVLIDQSQLRQRQRELHASQEQSLTRLPLELLNGLRQIPAHELSVPIDPVQGARHDVLLCRVDRPGEGFHPIRPRSRPRWRPKRCLHHFVSHPAKEEGIGLVEVLDCVTMQVFVRQYCAMIAAPVQCDVDGIPKGSHYASVPPMG